MDKRFIDQTVQRPEYNFLKDHERLGDNLIFLTLGGSHAYGTNGASSDIDVRGVTMNSASDLIGFSNFEQFENNPTDTVIYGFNKFVKLALQCNPNIIELLGCREDTYIVNNQKIYDLLIGNRQLFLSQQAVHSFGGYAHQQFQRLKNAIARGNSTEEQKDEHIRESLDHFISGVHSRYTGIPKECFQFSLKKIDDPDAGKSHELVCSINNLVDYPVGEFKSIISEMGSLVKDYNKLNGRNRKKDDAHLNKHAMHLVRLYLMAFDILEKGEIITYREDERTELLSIRNGKYQDRDGRYTDEFFDMVEGYNNRLKYAKANTALPKNPDMKKIEELVMEINREVIVNGIGS